MFSVVMPYYKNINVVEKSIESVLSQKEAFELVIVDDGSNDSISALITKIGDERIRLIQQKNQGVSAARNTAIRNSTGDWICFLDSDDEWTEEHLKEVKKMQLEYPNDLFFVTSHKREGNREFYSSSLLPDENKEYYEIEDLLRYSLIHPGIIHTNSVCIHRSLIESCGCFVEGVNSGEDTDLWYKCSLFARVIFSKKTTTIYHRENSFLTKKKSFNYHWIFLESEKKLSEDRRISADKKYSLRLFCQNYRLSMCKRYIAEGKKKEAVEIFNSLNSNLCMELLKEYKKVGIILKTPRFLAKSVLAMMYYFKEKNY